MPLPTYSVVILAPERARALPRARPGRSASRAWGWRRGTSAAPT
ncbi:hypothetical protein NKH77_01890 [Streptomyces sp. M19]